MTMTLLNLDAAPFDPISRLLWLTGVKEQAAKELDLALADAYYNARLQGQFEPALEAGPYGRKTALRLTRQENERRGRSVRWSDGLDPTSTAYEG